MSNVNTFKDIVLEFLSFLHFKVNNDLLTMEEIESMARVMEENLTVVGTAEDLSRFYNQPRTNISSVLHRKVLAKPVRKVYYSFNAFRKVVPSKWRYHSKVIDSQSNPMKM